MSELKINDSVEEYPDFFNPEFWRQRSVGSTVEFSPKKKEMQMLLTEACKDLSRGGWRFHVKVSDGCVSATVLRLPSAKLSPKGLSLRDRIVNQITTKEGQTLGVIKNRLRDFNPEDVEMEIKIMVNSGVAEAFRGPRSDRYRLV